MFARLFSTAARSAVRAAPRAVLARAAAGGVALSLAGVAAIAAAPSAASEGLPYTGVPGTPHERTFVALKPDAVQRGLIGEIIARFEKKGYKLVAMKLVKPSRRMAEEHYSDLAGKPFYPGLVSFFSSGPIIAMVWEGQNSIKGTRQMLGTTNPEQSLPGSIRGDFCVVTGRNIIHASDSAEAAKHEISHWFAKEEVTEWVPAAATWVYEGK